MKKLTVLDWIALVLVIVGGVNWGLVGVFGIDLVEAIFSEGTILTKAVYDLVGLAAVYVAVTVPVLGRMGEGSVKVEKEEE